MQLSLQLYSYTMELPEQLRDSAEWRPAVDITYAGSVTLSALPAAEEW
jgi:hypothetical protein